MQRLDPKTTAVVIIDIQDRLAAAMPEEQLSQVVRSARILVEGARLLGAPLFVTEQYPKGLGATLAPVNEALEGGDAARFEKLCFSAWEADGFAESLERSKARAAVVIGMESHVCVYQTVRDLAQRGLEVHVPIDGVSSRRADHQATGIALCERAGAVSTTTETVVFDWLAKAGGDAFKQLSKLIR
ncbi:MAG: isochorismatase family protein [Polyangiaceae bacterium]|nr:isochorismatase family protein [Myxococcales bacterium]MCB9584292.1 isochorismatase family protein [Polyangiaceae bacterium]